MSEVITKKFAADACVECVLAQTDCYIETLSIQAIDAQPGLLELVVRTQLLSAKKPSDKRVKSRTCIERSKLLELHQGIGRFLQATAGSPNEPVIGFNPIPDSAKDKKAEHERKGFFKRGGAID